MTTAGVITGTGGCPFVALVVFFRAVNVGGHQTFKPSELAASMADFAVESIGAAGTFIVRSKASPLAVRDEVVRRLSFAPELMIRPAAEVVDLVRSKPFGASPPAKDVKRYLSVLAKAPEKSPKLPLARPPAGAWRVRVLKAIGPFVLSLYRRIDDRVLYPNEVVEKEFAVGATTRGWETVEKLVARLEAG